MAGRAARQLGLLDQQHVAPARLGQVIGDAAAGDAAADHDHLGAIASGSAKLVWTTSTAVTIVAAVADDAALDELLDLVPALPATAHGRASWPAG